MIRISINNNNNSTNNIDLDRAKSEALFYAF